MERTSVRMALAIVFLYCASPAILAASERPVRVHGYSWRIIRSSHYDMIFPDILEREARYAVSCLEYMWPSQDAALRPERHHRFPVILNPDHMSPNGFVAVFPRRSGFYTAPDTRLPGDWLSLLAVHEGRHSFQLQAHNRSTSRVLGILFGEYSSLLGFLAPMWWFEGDAVIAETVYTRSGRGRNPRFTAQMKALLLEDTPFHYDKMLLGSYDEMTLNPYELGYLMQTYMRSAHDPSTQETLFKAFAEVPLPAFGPHRAMKRATGKGAGEIYREMVARYAAFWKDQVARLTLTPSVPLAAQDRSTHRTHEFLARSPDGLLVASVTDKKRGYSIVALQDGNERRLSGGFPRSGLSAGGPLIAWDELESDAKFDASRSRIVLYDTRSSSRRTFMSGTRYLSPALSPDGSRMALVEFMEDTSMRLVLIDTASREEIRAYPIPRGEIWADLSFLSDGRSLVFVSSSVFPGAGSDGKAIKTLDLEGGALRVLYHSQWESVRQPTMLGSVLYYSSNASGIDAIWAIEPDGSRYQVVSRPIGAYSPVPIEGGAIFFVDYASSFGTVVSQAAPSRHDWVPAARVVTVPEEFFADAAITESGAKGVANVGEKSDAMGVTDATVAALALPRNVTLLTTPSEDYDPVLSGNRITGWGVLPLIDGDTGASAFLQGSNIAKVVEESLFLSYDYTDRAFDTSLMFRYAGFYPDLVLRGGYTARPAASGPDLSPKGSFAVEFPFAAGSLGFWRMNARAGSSIGAESNGGSTDLVLLPYVSDEFTYGRFSIAFTGRWRFIKSPAQWRNHPFATAYATIPLLTTRDSISFRGSYERRTHPGDPVSIAFARGYYASASKETFATSAEYSFDLFYPDVSIGSLAYVNLIRLKGFIDYRDAWGLDERQMSCGIELLLHAMPLQLPFELDFGLRYSRLLSERLNKVDVVIIGIPVTTF